jgi:hypothetical protein
VSAVETIAGDLILPDWGLIATCGNIDFETGGTMSVPVYLDPQISSDHLPLSTPTEEDFRKLVSDPETIALLMKQARPSLRRSPDTRQILHLTFASRDNAPYFDWVLHQGMDRLMKGGQAIRELGRADADPAAVLRLLLSHLGRLAPWGEVNRYVFSAYRLLVDPSVAESLSLTGECVTVGGRQMIIIFKKRVVWQQ